MSDAPSECRKARTRVASAPAASDGPTILDAEAFTHGGVRKATFAPKVPQRRLKKTAVVKKEIGESADTELSSDLQKLIKQSTEGVGRRGYGTDKKSPQVRVTFGYGSSNTFGRGAPGNFRGASGGGGGGSGGGGGFRGSDKKPSFNDGMHGGMFIDKTGKQTKEFVDPMDYSTYYPVTLPLRKPCSGKSELLDEEEFGEGSTNKFDEDTIVPAQELGLWQESEEDKILFFQLPASLPLGRLPVPKSENAAEMNSGSNGKTVSRSDVKGAISAGAQNNADNSILEKLPAGFMGKLLIYESGAVKMKLGDALLDAVPGSECIFVQDVAAVNSVTKHCCFLGDIKKRVTLVPDVDSLLDNTVEIG